MPRHRWFAPFVRDVMTTTSSCGHCSKTLRPGDVSLVSRRGSTVKKRVCSEACARDFELEYFSSRADVREERNRR